MSDHLVQTIDMLVSDVSAKEKELAELKRTINYLCGKASIPVKYEQIDVGQANTTPVSMTISPDRYHGMKLNTAVTDYLKMRLAVNPSARAASADEIYDALTRGGYAFEQSSKDDRMHSLKTSLGKSTHTFRQVQKGLYGLSEWYGGADPKQRRTRKPGANGTEGGLLGGEEGESDEAGESTGEDSESAAASQSSK